MINDFTTKFVCPEEAKFPLVKAAFRGVNGNVYVGFVLVDSGSMHCILNKTVLPLLDAAKIKADDLLQVHTVQNNATLCQGVEFSFQMGTERFDETFYVSEQCDFSEVFDDNFIGIIGHKFLRKYKLVIDYATQTLRSSSKTDSYEKSDFVYSMKEGLNAYNLPVVCLKGESQDYLMVVDSGANSTLLTKHVVEVENLGQVDTSQEGSITCFNNANFATSIQRIPIKLYSKGVVAEKEYLDEEIEVMHHHRHLIENLKNAKGEILPPLSGLLSSDFMMRHKWVLDFGAELMYSA